MARARNIKPGFFLNDELAECDPLARLLFAGLWCIADREGRLEDRPKKIKAEVLPYDDYDVDKFLNDLQSHGFIKRYEINGERYIQIINFKKHQNPHVKEAPSIIPPPEDEPAPEKHYTCTVQEPEKHTENPADSLVPRTDSLNPRTDSLIPAPDGADDCIPPAEKSSTDDGAQGKPGKGDTYSEEFERFWSIYPRKVDKKRAFRMWKRQIKAKVPPDELIAAASNYAIYCQGKEPNFIKHAATFLGPDEPFKEFIKGPPESIPNTSANLKNEPKSWSTLRALYQKYQAEEGKT